MPPNMSLQRKFACGVRLATPSLTPPVDSAEFRCWPNASRPANGFGADFVLRLADLRFASANKAQDRTPDLLSANKFAPIKSGAGQRQTRSAVGNGP